VVPLLFPAGILLDRFSTRRILIACMAVCSFATLGFGLAPNIWFAGVCRGLIGVTAAFGLLSAIQLASRWFQAEKMALVIGLVVTLAMVGGMISQTPIAYLVEHLGWRRAIVVNAGFGFLLLIAMIAFVREYPRGYQEAFQIQQAELAALGFWRSIYHVLKNAQNWLCGLYTSLMNFPIFVLAAVWADMYLMQTRGFTKEKASLIVSMIYFGMIIGCTCIGWISDRMRSRKRPMIVCALLALVFVFAIMYTPHMSFMEGILLFFLLGLVISGQILSYPLIAELNPPYLTGSAEGVAAVLIMAGGYFQPVFGWLLDWRWQHAMKNGIRFYSVHDYNLAMWMLPAAFIISLVIAFFIKDSYPGHHSRLEQDSNANT